MFHTPSIVRIPSPHERQSHKVQRLLKLKEIFLHQLPVVIGPHETSFGYVKTYFSLLYLSTYCKFAPVDCSILFLYHQN